MVCIDSEKEVTVADRDLTPLGAHFLFFTDIYRHETEKHRDVAGISTEWK